MSEKSSDNARPYHFYWPCCGAEAFVLTVYMDDSIHISVFSDFPSTFYDIDVRSVWQCLHAIVRDNGAFTRMRRRQINPVVTINSNVETDPPLWLVESRVGAYCVLENKPSPARAETGHARVPPLEHDVRLWLAAHRHCLKFVEDIS